MKDVLTRIKALVSKEAAAVEHLRCTEKELEEVRTSLAVSQIQSHFLFNTLNTIRCLCRTDPEQAERAIESFTRYLRENMTLLTQRTPILFRQELDHLEYYLSIERLRFPDIVITYDIKAWDFVLPALTVQPIVENAINHGVLGREWGGTVMVSSWEDESAHYVGVEDDGIGFDPEQLSDGEGLSGHVGIRNTRSRLKRVCGGDLILKSKPGKGTCATIIIPRRGPNEGHSGGR